MDKQIVGQKVILRQQIDGDADFFVRWYNNKNIMEKCGFTQKTTKEEIIASFHKQSSDGDWYTVVDKETGRVIGETGLLRMFPKWATTDLTIIIPNPEDYGKGYGTETINLMFDLAFTKLNFNRIAIGVVGFNHSALSFYKKVGFKQEGIQEQGYFYDGEFSDFIMMRLLKSEYLAK
ncbi:GNAT family N-acetyltransferase [Sedimentibacter sp. zth1]|uniref:GNAT family N-acetyltransferase n=1 Tax=Sedimentibacter sp. zth1 TaxID=2816908 RepID=UPI001A934B15|nr:GNAT family protein [Sedimentibacter sp. zth1]QSX06456.1 GNAT family N-acetyltransferase [Sedimentibacter sp. zth1]